MYLAWKRQKGCKLSGDFRCTYFIVLPEIPFLPEQQKCGVILPENEFKYKKYSEKNLFSRYKVSTGVFRDKQSRKI